MWQGALCQLRFTPQARVLGLGLLAGLRGGGFGVGDSVVGNEGSGFGLAGYEVGLDFAAA